MVMSAAPVKQLQVHNDPNFSIFIKHIPTQREINFDGWVSNFSDSFHSTWSGTPVYGRMDDLYTFQRTARKISIQFDVLAASQEQAAANQASLNQLTQFLYPVYTDQGSDCGSPRGRNQRILSAPPLLKMSWANLIENSQDMGGLVGFLQGFSYNPTMEAGQFFSLFHPGLVRAKGMVDVNDPDVRPLTAGIYTTEEAKEQKLKELEAVIEGHVKGGQGKVLNYQQFSVQLEFTVLHTHLTGWSRDKDGNFIFGGDEAQGDLTGFPHRAGTGGYELMEGGNISNPFDTATPSTADPDTEETPEQAAQQCEVLDT